MEHPDAQDTLQGITEWWLLDRYIQRQIAEVKQAIEELASRRLVLARQGRDSRVRYRLNPEKIPEIEALVRGDA